MQSGTRRRLIRIVLIILLFPPLLAAIGGWFLAPTYLHPPRRQMTADLVREAESSFAQTGSHQENFVVRAPDGVLLRGWKVKPPQPNGSWVLLFHGVADNRTGCLMQSEFLLKAGYSVTMMDARAHGESDGAMASYGTIESADTSRIIDALVASEHPTHIYALGESMGAGIALISTGADSRIEAAVAEAPFSNLTEAAYDYAGLRKSPLLGKTWLAPFAWTLVWRGRRLVGPAHKEISPEQAVAERAFPVFLICDEKDEALPCRHAQRIFAAARGPKELWMVPGAFHTAGIGFAPEEFRKRVLTFFADPRAVTSETETSLPNQPAAGPARIRPPSGR